METPSNPVSHTLLAQIAEAIRAIRFGSVQILIHDSRVVQIEKAEKIRMCHEADRTTGGSPQQPGPSRPKEDRWNAGLHGQ